MSNKIVKLTLTPSQKTVLKVLNEGWLIRYSRFSRPGGVEFERLAIVDNHSQENEQLRINKPTYAKLRQAEMIAPVEEDEQNGRRDPFGTLYAITEAGKLALGD